MFLNEIHRLSFLEMIFVASVVNTTILIELNGIRIAAIIGDN